VGLGDFIEGVGNAAGSTVGVDDLGSRTMDGLSELDSQITGDQSRAELRAQQQGYATAQQQGNADRAGIYSEQSGLHGQVRDGFDPTSISDVENFGAMDHQAIRTAADGMSEGSIRDAASTWRGLGDSVEGKFTELRQTLSSTIAHGWEGQAASAASITSTRYADHGASLGPAFALTATKMEEAATGAGQTNLMVPPVVPFNAVHAVIAGTAKAALGIGSPADDAQQQSAAAEVSRLQAVRVMNSVYAPVYQQADAGVPTYAAPTAATSPPPAQPPAPPAPPVPPWSPGGPVPNPGNPTPWGGTHPTGGTGTPQGGWVPTPQTAGTVTAPAASATAPGTSQGSAGQHWANGSVGNPNAGGGSFSGGGHGSAPSAISSAGYTAPGYGARGSGSGDYGSGGTSGYGVGGSGSSGYGAGGYGAGGSGSGGSGRSGFGAGGYGAGGFGAGGTTGYGAGGFGGGGSGYGGGSGSGGSGSGGAGGTGRGLGAGPGAGYGSAGSGGGPAGAGGSAATTAGGRAGSSGMSGMGGGRGGKGEDDYEHNTPSYLITEENGSELVGEMPAVAPPVIGA
jgi:hypothetical protein